MENKRKLVLDAFKNLPVPRVPVGFRFHFTGEHPVQSVYQNPEMRDINIQGHKKFVETYHPDFIKIMSDGYFFEPETEKILQEVKGVADLKKVKLLDEQDKWIEDQASLVKELTDTFGGEILSFYNIFAPATSLKWMVGGDEKLADLIQEDKEIVRDTLNIIAQNTSKLVNAIIHKGNADGIYLSAQMLQDSRISPELYREIISPTEISVLKDANEFGGINILHVCGYKGAKNDLNIFGNYPAKAISFASVVEGVSLSEGKKIFGGKTVIGGFENTKQGTLYRGTKEEVQKETNRILTESGRIGIILGADCTVPMGIDCNRFEWVREAAS